MSGAADEYVALRAARESVWKSGDLVFALAQPVISGQSWKSVQQVAAETENALAALPLQVEAQWTSEVMARRGMDIGEAQGFLARDVRRTQLFAHQVATGDGGAPRYMGTVRGLAAVADVAVRCADVIERWDVTEAIRRAPRLAALTAEVAILTMTDRTVAAGVHQPINEYFDGSSVVLPNGWQSEAALAITAPSMHRQTAYSRRRSAPVFQAAEEALEALVVAVEGLSSTESVAKSLVDALGSVHQELYRLDTADRQHATTLRHG